MGQILHGSARTTEAVRRRSNRRARVADQAGTWTAGVVAFPVVLGVAALVVIETFGTPGDCSASLCFAAS